LLLLAVDPVEDRLNNPVPRPSILLLILNASSTREAMSFVSKALVLNGARGNRLVIQVITFNGAEKPKHDATSSQSHIGCFRMMTKWQRPLSDNRGWEVSRKYAYDDPVRPRRSIPGLSLPAVCCATAKAVKKEFYYCSLHLPALLALKIA